MSSVRMSPEQLEAALKKNRGLRVAGDTSTEKKAQERTRIHQVAPAPAQPKESKLERRFAQQLAERPRIPAHQRNYFFLPDREFELDFAWPALKLAVEVQGQAHRVKGRFKADIEKRALALLGGWRVLEVDGDAVRSGRGVQWLEQILGCASG